MRNIQAPIFAISDILAAIPGARFVGPAQVANTAFEHLACHTVDIIAGRSLFAAVRGDGPWYVTSSDGFDHHRHLAGAVAAGARGLLLERVPSGLNTSELPVVVVPDVIEALCVLTKFLIHREGIGVIAVTGSTGKTSTCEMAASVVRQHYKVFKFISARATPISVPRELLNSQLTVPDRLIVEMPMDGPRQIARLCQITPPSVAAVLNVNDSHVVQLGSIEAIADAKAEILEALSASGFAVLNFDDARVRAMATRTSANVISVGTGPDCQLRARNVALDAYGVTFRLDYAQEKVQVRLATPSRAAIINALLAAGIGLAEGIDLATIAAGLRAFRTLPGRMSPLRGNSGFVVLDNSLMAVPQSTELILQEALRIPSPGTRILVQGWIFGEDQQHGQIPENVFDLMARFDLVILNGPLADAYIEPLSLRLGNSRLLRTDTSAEAATLVAGLAKADDIVLVNGSLEDKSEMIVSNIVHPDDRHRVVTDHVRRTT